MNTNLTKASNELNVVNTVTQADLNLLAELAKPVVRTLSVVAREITKDWSATKSGIYFGAVPYLAAMRSLDNITDNYMLDSGTSVVRYFLANASTYRGETAKRCKAELKDMLKKAGG